MRLEEDIRALSGGQARQEIARLRRLIRTHRDREEDARCWHADQELYSRALPETQPPGRMRGPKQVLLAHCSRYIDRQQCQGCPLSRRPARR